MCFRQKDDERNERNQDTEDKLEGLVGCGDAERTGGLDCG